MASVRASRNWVRRLLGTRAPRRGSVRRVGLVWGPWRQCASRNWVRRLVGTRAPRRGSVRWVRPSSGDQGANTSPRAGVAPSFRDHGAGARLPQRGTPGVLGPRPRDVARCRASGLVLGPERLDVARFRWCGPVRGPMRHNAARRCADPGGGPRLGTIARRRAASQPLPPSSSDQSSKTRHHPGEFCWVTGGRRAYAQYGWTRIDEHDHPSRAALRRGLGPCRFATAAARWPSAASTA